MNLSNIRYYLNYVLPDIIKNKIFNIIDFLSSSLWWVFLLISIVLFILLLFIYKKFYNIYRERRDINKFLKEIAIIENIQEFEKKLLEFRKFLKAKYIAFYALKGETFVLQTHNIENTNKDVGTAGANIYIVKKLVKTKSKSGNFVVSTYVSAKEDFLIQVFAYRFINLKIYSGYIETIFGIYRKLLKTDEISMKVKLTTITKEIQSVISKSLLSERGYLHYILTLIKNAISAVGIKVYENGKNIFSIGKIDEKSLNVKRFYIHNTGYFVDILIKKELSPSEMKRIGTFLDMTGMFISTFDGKNNIAKFYIEFLITATEMFESRDKFFINHSRKVSIIAVEIGKTLLYDLEELKLLKLGAFLHDVGMIADITNIIEKSEDLSKEQLSMIKLHPLIGAILIEPISYIYPITPIIKYHHERIDGSGYPFKLSGKEIPEMAQIVALAEFFVGLISDRQYKKGMEIEKAKELILNSGRKMFDSVIVDGFIDSFDSIQQKFLKIDLQNKLSENEINEKKD